MITTATRIEDLTLGITRKSESTLRWRRRLRRCWSNSGPFNETTEAKPMPMKLEAWPGGRWYRDLGDNNGHFWGVVQASSGRLCSKLRGRWSCPIRSCRICSTA